MCAIGNLELRDNIFHVRLYRLFGKRERVSDSLVRIAAGDKLQDLDFSRAKLVIERAERDGGCDVGVQVALSTMYFSDGAYKVATQTAL